MNNLRVGFQLIVSLCLSHLAHIPTHISSSTTFWFLSWKYKVLIWVPRRFHNSDILASLLSESRIPRILVDQTFGLFVLNVLLQLIFLVISKAIGIMFKTVYAQREIMLQHEFPFLILSNTKIEFAQIEFSNELNFYCNYDILYFLNQCNYQPIIVTDNEV